MLLRTYNTGNKNKSMKLCLLSALLFATFLQASVQDYACYSCNLNADINKCHDPYVSPPNIPVEPGLCDKISNLPNEQTKLCKQYTRDSGYNVVCNVGQMSFSCRASCGVKFKDVGNFSQNPHFRNSIGSNLLKSLGQDSQEQNVDLLNGAGGYGKDFPGFSGQPNGGGYGNQNSKQLVNQANGAHAQNPNAHKSNNNNNNYNGNNPYLQSFDQNYQPHGAFDVYKPLTLPGQNPQYTNFNFQPLPPPKRTVPKHPPTYHQPKAPQQPQGYQQQGAPVQGYQPTPQNQGGYQQPQSQGYQIQNQPGYPRPQPLQNQAGYPQHQAQQGYPQHNAPSAHPVPHGQPAVQTNHDGHSQPAGPVYSQPQAPPAGYQPAAPANQAYPQPHVAVPQAGYPQPNAPSAHLVPHGQPAVQANHDAHSLPAAPVYSQPQAPQAGYPQPNAPNAQLLPYGQPAVQPNHDAHSLPAAPVYSQPQATQTGYPAQPAAPANQAYPQPHVAVPHVDPQVNTADSHAAPHAPYVGPVAAAPSHALHPDPTPTNLPVGPFLPRDPNGGYQTGHNQGAGDTAKPTHATLPLGKPNPTDLLSAVNAIPHNAPHDPNPTHHIPHSHLHNILANTVPHDTSVPHPAPAQAAPANQDHSAPTGIEAPPHPVPISLPVSGHHGPEGFHLPVAPSAGAASLPSAVHPANTHPAPAVGPSVPHPPGVYDVPHAVDPHVDPHANPGVPHANLAVPHGNPATSHGNPANPQGNVPRQNPVAYPSLPVADPHANPYQHEKFTSFKDFEPFPGQPSSSVSQAADPYANRHDGSDLPSLNLPNVPDYGANYNVQPKQPHDNYAAKAIGYPLNSFNSGYGQVGQNMLANLNHDLSHQANNVKQNNALAGLKGRQNKQTSSASSNHGGYNTASSSNGSKQGGNTVHFAKGDSSNLLDSLGGSNQHTGSSTGVQGVKGFHGKPQSHDMFNKLGNHAGYFKGFNSVAPKGPPGKDAKPSKHVFSNPFFNFMSEGR